MKTTSVDQASRSLPEGEREYRYPDVKDCFPFLKWKIILYMWVCIVAQGKESGCSVRDAGDTGLDPWVKKISWRKVADKLHSSILAGKLHDEDYNHGTANSWTQLKQVSMPTDYILLIFICWYRNLSKRSTIEDPEKL